MALGSEIVNTQSSLEILIKNSAAPELQGKSHYSNQASRTLLLCESVAPCAWVPVHVCVRVYMCVSPSVALWSTV